MKAMIIGGAGFVGLNVAETLLRAGRDVVAFDRQPVPESARVTLTACGGRLETIVGDVRDAPAVADALAAHRPSHLVLGGAITAAAERERDDPETILAVNLGALVPVLRAARDAGVRRTVNLSSGAAYGAARFDGPLVIEAVTAAEPDGLYAITKYASERIVRRLAELWRMDAVSVRLSAVYGPWERDTGVRDTLSPQMRATRMALAGDGEMILPGPGRRDWIYARDVGRAVAEILAAPALRHDLYNVGSGVASSVTDWCRLLSARFPAFRWRLAAAGEAPTLPSAASGERPPMSVARLRSDTDFDHRFPVPTAFDDMMGWVDRHRDYWETAT